MGTHQLLILNGYEIHNPLKFKQYCKENNIVTLCILLTCCTCYSHLMWVVLRL
jgi:hypothetical protein